MKCLQGGIIVFAVVVCVLCTEDTSDVEENVSEESQREMRKFNQEGWKVVENHPPSDTSGWIPHDQSEEQQEQLPKRRRLRKRKRRPPMISLTDDSTEEVQPLRRRVRPQRLDQMHEPWDEMTNENVRRPLIRRRITPVYQPSDDIITSEQVNMSPMSATIQFAQEDDPLDNTVPKSSPKPDLKTLLKQSEGRLSLSELLQQKNLSLSELLMGNEKAISALTLKPLPSTEPTISSELEDGLKYKRLPPSIGLRKTINRNYEQDVESIETLTSRETIEAQRKRLALLHSHKDNKIYKEMTKYEVVTEPTTEKRIFVPSHPKYYTSLNFKPDFEFTTEATFTEAPKQETTTNPPEKKPTTRFTQLPKVKASLPVTSAKLNKMISKVTTVIPPTAIKITLNEILSKLNHSDHKVEESRVSTQIDEAPLRMTIDLNDFVQATEKPSSINPKIEDFVQTTEKPATTIPKMEDSSEVLGEKVRHVTAKEEIMEILQDPISRDKLSRILKTRNMTVEELVQQRERGSSQLHLADIFHNKTREPEPRDEPFVGQINSEFLTNFPIFGRRQKSRQFPDMTSTSKPLPHKVLVKNIEPTRKPKEIYTVTSFPTYKIETDKKFNKQPFLWKELYPDLFTTVYQSDHQKVPSLTQTESYSDLDLDNTIQHLDGKFDSVSNEELNVELNEKIYNSEDEVFINLPSGVKSAILASLAIVGLSLLVFVTILVIFRWSQKKKTRLNYCSSFSSRFKSPILDQSQRKTIKTFMTETLGRKKNYYKNSLQSMSDNIWENDRKPSY